MAASALIKLTQGATIGSGQSIKGSTGILVSVENVDNTDVASWQLDLVYVDPSSGVAIATPFAFDDNGSTPLATFTPDVKGCYRWVLKVWGVINRVGNPVDIDIRIFAVPEDNGLVTPPAQIWPLPLPSPASGASNAKPSEFNFSGQTDGWAGDGSSDGLLNELIRRVDSLKTYFNFLVGGGVSLYSKPLTDFFSHAAPLDGTGDTSIAADSNPHLIDSYTFPGSDGDVVAIGIRVWGASTAIHTGKHVYETTAYIQVGAASSDFLVDPATLQLEANALAGLTLSYAISGTNILQVNATSTTTALYAALECWNQPARTITNP